MLCCFCVGMEAALPVREKCFSFFNWYSAAGFWSAHEAVETRFTRRHFCSVTLGGAEWLLQVLVLIYYSG